jgi:glycosyltransferase involved in cell wall biosynthesis
MNILILSWRSLKHPNAGGAEKVTFEHAKAWTKEGHRVFIFSSYFEGAEKSESLEGVEILRRGDYIFGVRKEAFLWYFFGKHPKFDLVVDEFHGLPFFTPLYVKVKKLAFIHEVARDVWKHNPWKKPFNIFPTILGTYLEPLIFKLLYKNVHFMTVSESTRDDLMDWGIPRGGITIIHNGVNLDLPKKSYLKENKATVMYLGAISEDKGTEDAIKAFGEINRKDDQWQFWVVGPGTKDLINNLKKRAEELEISDKLTFWNFVTDRKKFELLERAHVLINPSVHEGWGLVNIEANAVGTPIVAYNVHGIRDSVQNGKTGILVEKGDYRSLAQELLKLVKDEVRYKRFQENAKKWAVRFTWEKATKMSLELIESL